METDAVSVITSHFVLPDEADTFSESPGPPPQSPIPLEESVDDDYLATITNSVESLIVSEVTAEKCFEDTSSRKNRRVPVENGEMHNLGRRVTAEADGTISNSAARDDSPDWTRAPHLVLVYVCRRLSVQGRLNMALTCRSWAAAFQDARVWQSAVLPARAGEGVGLPESTALLRHTGRYIRSLTLTTPVFAERGACERILSAFSDLALESLEVDLQYHPKEGQGDDEEGEGEDLRFESQYGLYRALWQLPWIQPAIRRITIRHVHFPFASALDALRRLPSKLDTLVLENFFQLDETDRRDLDEADERSLNEALKRFTPVRTLGLNFCLLSDDLVRALASRGRLEHLLVFADLVEEPESVRAESWRLLTSSCPDLRTTVKCTLDDFDSVLNAMVLLTSVQKVFRLHVDISHDEVSESLVTPFIEFVARECGPTLTEFCMSGHRVYDMDAELISLVCSCSRLRRVALHRCASVNLIETVCFLQSEKTCCLSRFDVSVFQCDPFYCEEKLMSMQKAFSSLYCYNEQWIPYQTND